MGFRPFMVPVLVALVLPAGPAVVGLAVQDEHPIWPDTRLADVYCHPAHWDRAADLLAGVLPARDRRCLAYADSTCPAKHEVLAGASFRPAATLPGWLAAARSGAGSVDVTVFERPAS